MKHEIEKSDEGYVLCSCGQYFQGDCLGDKYIAFSIHKKRAEQKDAFEKRLAKRDCSEVIKKWSGRIGHISGTTGHQCMGIPIWERKIGNYFVLCYFFERTFGGGVPKGEVFGVVEEMSDGSLKPIILGIQIDIIFKGVIRKIEIEKKKLIISYMGEDYCRRIKLMKQIYDLTETHDVLRIF